MEDEVAVEVEQQVLAAGLGALEAAAVEPLDSGGAAARVRRATASVSPPSAAVEPPRQAQDRVALCHRPIMTHRAPAPWSG